MPINCRLIFQLLSTMDGLLSTALSMNEVLRCCHDQLAMVMVPYSHSVLYLFLGFIL